MTWRYTFDDGPEKALDCPYSQYTLAAMRAFACEWITKMPDVKSPGIEPYDGHVLKLWDEDLIPTYGPYRYGVGYNECGSLVIVNVEEFVDSPPVAGKPTSRAEIRRFLEEK